MPFDQFPRGVVKRDQLNFAAKCAALVSQFGADYITLAVHRIAVWQGGRVVWMPLAWRSLLVAC